MKKNLKKNKGLTIIQGILIILIIPLYIIYFANYLNEKTANFLIAVAAIVSTIFLFLAFREARKANQLKKSDLIISDFQDYIHDIDKELSKTHFNISNEAAYPFTLLKNMTFKKFNKDLIDFVMQIIKDDDFLLCHKLLANCENHEFNDDVKFDSIKSMLIQLSELNFFIAHFLLKEMEYLRLLKAIDNSNVEPVHKDILMKNADNIFSDVIVFHYAYNKNENFHDGINQIRSIYFKNNKLSKVQPFSLNAYDDTVYFPIQNLRIKYIDEK